MVVITVITTTIYLQNFRQILFNELVLSDMLFEHCLEIEETARDRIDYHVRADETIWYY